VPSLDPAEDFSRVLVRRFLVLCESPRTRRRMLRLVKGSNGSARAGRRLYALINRLVLNPVVVRTPLPATSIRWELVVSQLIGIAMLRYVVRLEPIASASIEEVVELSAPSIQLLLSPSRPDMKNPHDPQRRIAGV